ncbi:elicitor-responsive protein 1-like [Phoenix dactylifera]|uniref:Elicitor-responsive protein 1-like n=1 Tax=Phoenix dactylifera TaxID=42345 RepID=A0A8B7D5R8_PHODC|nr:elicitor-responsive protein 1-like [Phoenix dactylifera]
MSTVSGIQGQILEITVVGCSKLRDTELFSRQDPYVCLEYANSKFRTRTCTDGGRNPTFQDKFRIPLIEGLREISIIVWNSNTFTADDFIGSGRVQLQKVLSQGYDDSSWPIQTRSPRYAGEVKLIMHFPNASKKTAESSTPSAPHYNIPAAPHVPPYAPSYPPAGTYPGAGAYGSYPPPDPSLYQASAYPQQPCPPAMYPPQPYVQQYPPPPPTQPYYPPGPYPGYYPPPY